jgi:LPS O-antigen subunit length determinant protein (WzzB/FepE family)
MREIEKQDAQNAIKYLSESTKLINVLSIKEVISKLLENQMQTLMLSSSNKSYIFRTIDSPIVSEEKARPSRALICIVGTTLGFIISLLIVLGLHLIRPSVK